MSSTYRRTVVNGYDAKLWDHSDSSPVRQFVAAVGRDNPGIDRVDTAVLHDVEVWIELTPDVEYAARIPTPDGFEVDTIRSVSSGGVNVGYNRVEQ